MGSSVLVNIGEQRFDRLREQHKLYIAKTNFIRECFFSVKYEGRDDLFEGLSIWAEEKYRMLQGTFPVIFMSFAGIKADHIDGMKMAVKQTITNVYGSCRDLMESDLFDENDRKYFHLVNDDMRVHMPSGVCCLQPDI